MDDYTDDERVILLLDLDCFYAQCECVRLGLDAATTPLCLMQWNSALAVSYPARRMGIKRGDGWHDIQVKSNGACHMVHTPIFSATSANDSNPDEDSATSSYESIFQMTTNQQAAARKRDIGYRRHSSEGKASIERYRIASTRIFQTVLEMLPASVVLERASIDEFFVDVTQADELDESEATTKVVGDVNEPTPSLLRGCAWAHKIRQHVFDTLGFTLSAGISVNKTLAKLSAGYGKPNGQAVTYPAGISFLLNDTPIRKCRNLGGKLGAKVQALLPEGAPTTVGAVAKYLSVSQLRQALNDDGVAQWVWNLARWGMEYEAVAAKHESGASKSITAFKSLPYVSAGHSLDSVQDWIRLLVEEVVGRVERDADKNSRYPRHCSVHYAPGGGKGLQNKSVRIAFPVERLTTEEKVEELCRQAPKSILNKEGEEYRVRRIGICAIDFTEKNGKNGIDTYFGRSSGENRSAPKLPRARESPQQPRATDPDLELARKLQAEYDRENRLLGGSRPTKKAKRGIDSFFKKA